MEFKSIFSANVARRLLKFGNHLVDIKPDKNNPEKTIFIFKKTEKFINDLAGLKNG
jgi:hypothetical protein